MTTKSTIYRKLWNVQKSVNGLKTDAKTTEGVIYSYLTSDKIFKVLKPVMNREGLLLKQEIISIQNTRIDYSTSVGKPKSEMMATVNMKFTWIDCETGEFDESLFAANGMNSWVQGVGSALAYAERYFVLKYFHIITDEDDFEPYAENEEPKAQTPKPASDAKPVPKSLPQNLPEMPTLPDLTPNNKEKWGEAVSWIVGGGSIETIRTKYVLTRENETILKKQATERVA